MKLKIILSSCICLILAGCMNVGPDYQGPPNMDIPQAWNHRLGHDLQLGLDNGTSDIAQWWAQLHDPQLDDLIKRAQSENQSVKIALSRIDQARALYGISTSERFPTIDASGSYTRQSLSDNIDGLAPLKNEVANLSAIASWEIDFFGRIRRQIEASEAEVSASMEDYHDILVILNSEIARNYVAVRTLQQRLELAHKNVGVQGQTLDVVKSRYEAELTSEIDVFRAQQNLSSSKSAIPLLKAALNRSLNRIAILIGKPPGAVHAELLEHKAIPKSPDRIMVAIPKDVVRQRPDIRRTERQLAAQTARIGIAEADLYPRISLSGIFGYAATSGSFLSASSEQWAFGPNLFWNIFDAGRIRSNIELQDARAEAARSNYEQTVLFAMEEVENSLTNYINERRRLAYLYQSVQAAQKSVKLAKIQYSSGLSNIEAVLDAERILFAEEDRLADSEGALVQFFIAIYRSMGGGWQEQMIANKLDQEETAQN